MHPIKLLQHNIKKTGFSIMHTRLFFAYALCFSCPLLCSEHAHRKHFSSSVDVAEYSDTTPAKKQKTQDMPVTQPTAQPTSLLPTGSIKPEELYRPIRNNRQALYLQLCELYQTKKYQPELKPLLTPYIDWLYKRAAPMYEQTPARDRNRDF